MTMATPPTIVYRCLPDYLLRCTCTPEQQRDCGVEIRRPKPSKPDKAR